MRGSQVPGASARQPYRDFKLYPLDQAQVTKLVASIGRHGFFGRVCARPRDDGKFELGFGHHRVAAARTAKLTQIDIDVHPMSDDEMLRLMVSENAIQAGSKAAAVMNEVGAVTRRLGKAMLAEDDLSQIRERWSEIAKCFQGQKAYETARGTLAKGDGIGAARSPTCGSIVIAS
jgi:ParB-like chromosome segregation protein Spo0J